LVPRQSWGVIIDITVSLNWQAFGYLIYIEIASLVTVGVRMPPSAERKGGD
jgi:hypothetical protein